MIPATAWTTPISSITPPHSSRASGSLAATPRSIARPMTAGMKACELIQMMPKTMPMTSVRHWALAIHHNSRPGD